MGQNGWRANLEKHYHELLGLTEGWRVRKVELELAKQRVEIDVEWTEPRIVSCPECGGSGAPVRPSRGVHVASPGCDAV